MLLSVVNASCQFLKFFHSLYELIQAPESGHFAFPVDRFFRREAAHVISRYVNILRDYRRATYNDVVANIQMPVNTGLAGEHASLTDDRASGNTGRCCQRTVFTDLHVVGDMDQVVNPHTIFNDRIVYRAATDPRAMPMDRTISSIPARSSERPSTLLP